MEVQEEDTKNAIFNDGIQGVNSEPIAHDNLSRTEKLENIKISDRGICWLYPPNVPWSLSYYLSEDGQSNIYIYLWIIKDLSWAQVIWSFPPVMTDGPQNWYWPAHVFGAATLVWQAYLLSQAVLKKDLEASWINFTYIMWLFGHYWWMVCNLSSFCKTNQLS
jgi:hypothetical protein